MNNKAIIAISGGVDSSVAAYLMKVGTKLKIGETSIGEVTQIGKVCHTRCAIFYQAGDCVMPREGIFIRLLKGGVVRVGDSIEVIA